MTRRRLLATIASLLLLAGCATGPAATPTPRQTMHITLKATVTGDGAAKATYTGDPTDPDGGVDRFEGSWQREFDIGYQDWAAIDKIELDVTESAGKNARVDCLILYDDTVGGHGHKTGPHKTTRCRISYGDVGDDNPEDTD